MSLLSNLTINYENLLFKCDIDFIINNFTNDTTVYEKKVSNIKLIEISMPNSLEASNPLKNIIN